MQHSLSLKSLIRLQRRQSSVGKKMRELIGWIIVLIYIWGLDILLYFMLKEQLAGVPPLYMALGLMGVLVPDFIFKLIFVRDQTVMNDEIMGKGKLIREMNRDLGTTVLVSSHNLTSINDLCDRLLLLEKGHLLMDKAHVPGSIDPELEAYFPEAVK